MKAYEYKSDLYLNEDDLETAIELNEGGEYNNQPVPNHIHAYIFDFEVDVVDVEPNSFDTFKSWCGGKKIKPNHAKSLEKYLKEVGR